jgi:lipooligosaccharide transport system ATP-binding protein
LEITPARLFDTGDEAARAGQLGELGQELTAMAGALVKSRQVLGDTLFLYTENGPELLSRIKSMAYEFSHQHLRPATLEDVFLKLTGRGLQLAGEVPAAGGEE